MFVTVDSGWSVSGWREEIQGIRENTEICCEEHHNTSDLFTSKQQQQQQILQQFYMYIP